MVDVPVPQETVTFVPFFLLAVLKVTEPVVPTSSVLNVKPAVDVVTANVFGLTKETI